MNSYLRSAIESIYGKDDDFVLIGLTGRTGSGCSTVATILQSKDDRLKHSLYSGSSPLNSEERKDRILNRLLSKIWEPFSLIQVRSVITLMLLECDECDVEKFILEEFELNPNNKRKVIRVFKCAFKANIPNAKTIFYTKDLPRISNLIKKVLGPGDFVRLYQIIGKNIRLSGNPLDNISQDGKFFTLAEKINSIAKKNS